jgi:hypothetical protein
MPFPEPELAGNDQVLNHKLHARVDQGFFGFLDHRAVDEGLSHGILQAVLVNTINHKAYLRFYHFFSF